MEYLIVFGTTVIGSATLLLIMRAIYRRGIAIRITILTAFVTIILGNVGFMMGREGLTTGRLILAVAIILPTIFGLHVWILKTLVNPARKIMEIASKMQTGDLDQDFGIHSNDEIGDIARSLNSIKEYQKEIAEVSTFLADGDLSKTIYVRSEADLLGISFSRMTANLREMVEKVAENSRQLAESSEKLANAAHQAGMVTGQISTTIQQIAVGTSDQANSITKTLSSIEEMSRAIQSVERGAREQSEAISKAADVTGQINSSIRQVAENAITVKTNSESTAEAARSGTHTMDETLECMGTIKQKVDVSAQRVEEMGKRSEEINAILETIEDIASQTNLLALNAAIEAARAGEHGKGFAVVADEVRKLAERSSLATKEIGTLITGIQQTVTNAVLAMNEGAREVEIGVKSANRAGAALLDILNAAQNVNHQAVESGEAAGQMSQLAEELVTSVDSVTAVVQQNTAATRQMQVDSTELTESMESIASISEQNSAAVEQVSAATEEMSGQVEEVSTSARSLADLAGELQTLIGRFRLSGV